MPKPLFSHGQLYIVVSKITSKQELKLLIHNNDDNPKNVTTKVVFKELFQKLWNNLNVVSYFNLIQVEKWSIQSLFQFLVGEY